MKKLLAILLVLVLCFSFAACGSSSSDSASNAAIVEYIEANEDDLIEGFESSFATSSGMTCTSKIDVIGMGFVITININELEDVSSDVKAQLQSAYDSMDSTFEPLLEQMQEELPDLEYFKIKVCDKNGELLATVKAGNE